MRKGVNEKMCKTGHFSVPFLHLESYTSKYVLRT